ncbi:MAG: phosphotransferase family protein [Parvibaculaceae bacterium]
MPDFDLASLKPIIVAHFPDLAHARFTLLPPGWHSTAVDVDDDWVFKFPRGEDAERALRKEASLLAAVRPHIAMPVPELSLIAGPPLFSRHRKLKGEHLIAADYAHLPERARSGLAAALARFYADLHGLDTTRMTAAGAAAIRPWLAPDDILRKAWPILPAKLRAPTERSVTAWRELAPDPYGTIYGFFDGHGWNMAFDHATRRLNGVYDFADSGLGPLHQDFIYSNFISRDLTSRIIAGYEHTTGRLLDHRRIVLLTTIHRLSELAEVADDPAHIPLMLKHLDAWMRGGVG